MTTRTLRRRMLARQCYRRGCTMVPQDILVAHHIISAHVVCSRCGASCMHLYRAPNAW